MSLLDEPQDGGGPAPDAAVLALLDTPRARSVAGDVARTGGRDVRSVRRGLADALLALQAVTGTPATARDLDRLLDAVVLSGS